MGVLEEPLKYILQTIKMKDETQKTTVNHFKDLRETFVESLKKFDPLFEALYQEPFYRGDYFDKIHVGLPITFDVELRLSLPKLTAPNIYYVDYPGFVSTQLTGYRNFERNTEQFKKYPGLKIKLLDDDDCLDSSKTIRWMQSVVDRALHAFDFLNFTITRQMTESTVALKIKAHPYEDVYFYINLVPCFVFDGLKWPNNIVKPAYFNDTTYYVEKTFSIEPKSTNSKKWRLSFPLQERRILESKTEFLRSGLRLLKHLVRDVYKCKTIDSYCIKTIGLWEIANRWDPYWSKASLSVVFLNLLIMLQKSVQEGVLRYYWNEGYNLIENVHLRELNKFLQRDIKKLINSTDGDEVYEIFETGPPQSLSTSDGAGATAGVVAGIAALGIGLFAAYKLSNTNRRSNE